MISDLPLTDRRSCRDCKCGCSSPKTVEKKSVAKKSYRRSTDCVTTAKCGRSGRKAVPMKSYRSRIVYVLLLYVVAAVARESPRRHIAERSKDSR